MTAAPIDLATIAARLPYVLPIKYPRHRWCDGWRTIAGRKQKCAQSARWQFVASKHKPKSGRAKAGNFCDYHLLTTLRSSKYEEARAERAFTKSGEPDVRN